MKRFKVYLAEEIHSEARKKLEDVAEIVDNFDCLEELDGVFLRAHRFDREQIVRAKKCKVVARHGVGMDNVDLVACKEHGIKVVYTPGANSNAVAEFAFAMGLCLMRNICKTERMMRTEGFTQMGPTWLRGNEVKGCTVGIVGMGRVGKILAGLYYEAFRCRVLVYDAFLNDQSMMQYHAKKVDTLEELVGQSDIVSICCPLTDDTRGMFNSELFEKFNPNAILINTARGPIVDEAAAYAALTTGKIRAMGTDVFVDETKVSECPLLKLDNFIGFPHVAANTHEAMYSMAMTAVDGLLDVLEGRQPQYLYPL